MLRFVWWLKRRYGMKLLGVPNGKSGAVVPAVFLLPLPLRAASVLGLLRCRRACAERERQCARERYHEEERQPFVRR